MDYENKTVKVPILNSDFHVVVCWGDNLHVDRVLKREGMQDVNVVESLMGNSGVTFMSPRLRPVIAIPRYPETAREVGTLAHEACHAVEHIFNQIGQKLGDELLAHSVGAVVRITLESKKDVQQISDKSPGKGKRQSAKAAQKKGSANKRAPR